MPRAQKCWRHHFARARLGQDGKDWCWPTFFVPTRGASVHIRALSAEKSRTKPNRNKPNKKETTMKTKTISGIKVKATVKAGGLPLNNHNRAGLKVRVGIKAGEILFTNHSRRLFAVR
jgi:CxxC motif-containing protein